VDIDIDIDIDQMPDRFLSGDEGGIERPGHGGIVESDGSI
jgi:hypothetical protein